MSTLSSFSKMKKPHISGLSKPNYKLGYGQRMRNLQHGLWVDEVGVNTKLRDIHSNYLLSLIIGLDKKIKDMPTNNKSASYSINLQWFTKLKNELNSRTDILSEGARVKLLLLGI